MKRLALAVLLCLPMGGCAVAVTRDKDGVQRVTAGFSFRTDEVATADRVTDTVLRGFQSVDGLLVASGLGGVSVGLTLLGRMLGVKAGKKEEQVVTQKVDNAYYEGKREVPVVVSAAPSAVSQTGTPT